MDELIEGYGLGWSEKHREQHGYRALLELWSRCDGTLPSWCYMWCRKILPEFVSPVEGSWSRYPGLGIGFWKIAVYTFPRYLVGWKMQPSLGPQLVHLAL